MKFNHIIAGIIVGLAMVFLVKGCGDAIAHEGHGFRHMKKGNTTGPCIRSRSCVNGISRWTIDDNHDGVADRCIDLIFSHNRMHIKDVSTDAIRNNICVCGGDL